MRGPDRLQPAAGSAAQAGAGLLDFAVPRAWRLTAWLLPAVLGAFLCWSWFGRVDVVATAAGRTVPSGQSKRVQAAEPGVVRRVHVHEGQQVEAGQLLVEFEDQAAAADMARFEEDMLALQLDRARLDALIAGDWRGTGDAPVPPALSQRVAPAVLALHHRQLAEERTAIQAALAGIDAEIREGRANARIAASERAALEQTLPLIEETARAHARLAARGTVARVDWLALERERISATANLAAARARSLALAAGVEGREAGREALVAQYRQRWLAELSEVERRLAGAEEDLAKARARFTLRRIEAPVAGSVQQLALHTVGAVVAPAETLLVIVPRQELLEVEARIENRDIGLVHAGQSAVVKFDAWEFTRHGYVSGTVTAVSADAITRGEERPWYLARIRLPAQPRSNLGRTLRLRPGMLTQVEIKLGRRRVLEFLLSPLRRYRDESGRER